MTKTANKTRFDFGQNWKSFSAGALNIGRVKQAREDFQKLNAGIKFRGQNFLDVGFGQGLALLLAEEAGAAVVGNDINPKCVEALKATRRYFPKTSPGQIPLVIGSILDQSVIDEIKNRSSYTDHLFDIVHSWGTLHHTGDMYRAITKTANLVRENGHYIIAIYNKHWTSKTWRKIKRRYSESSPMGQRVMIAVLKPVIWLAKLAVTGKNPSRKDRGMDFHHDVVDWVGGYPYEYATKEEIVDFVSRLGFKTVKVVPAQVFTGCNQFVFQKN